MKLFSKSDRPTREALESRIAELEQRAAAIPAELESARADLTRCMATGSDPKKHRAQVAELQAESESIAPAILALRGELVEIDVDREEAAGADRLKQAQTAGDAIARAHAKAAAAITDYRKVLDANRDAARLDRLQFGDPAIADPAERLNIGLHEIHRDTAARVEAIRSRAKRTPRTEPHAWKLDETENRLRPIREGDFVRSRVVSGAEPPDHTDDDSGHKGPERHGATILEALHGAHA